MMSEFKGAGSRGRHQVKHIYLIDSSEFFQLYIGLLMFK